MPAIASLDKAPSGGLAAAAETVDASTEGEGVGMLEGTGVGIEVGYEVGREVGIEVG
jgi:hypothetical protein